MLLCWQRSYPGPFGLSSHTHEVTAAVFIHVWGVERLIRVLVSKHKETKKIV